jgi:hypothetical protein
MRWRGYVPLMGRREIHMRFWWESKKRQLQRPRRRLDDNIKMDLREIELGDMDWIHLAQDRDHW